MPRYSPIVFTDEQRVMQVLLNLQSNALKFTQKGGVRIEVCISEKGERKYLQIDIIDSGVGIPYQDQDKLFKLFGFVKTTQSLNINGIGLGLVISRKIVKEFNGEIDFTSVPHPEPMHGSRFTFSF